MLVLGLLAASVVPQVHAQKTASAQTSRPTEIAPAQSGPVHARLQDRTFQSESLGRSMKYRILLPADYFQSARRYPVLYLLHGWHGDDQNWSTLTKLTAYAKGLSLIVVMPDANDSWYVNSATVPQDKFESYIARDLVAEIDSQWRTVPSAGSRAIAGLSMGGYGSVKFAEKFPELFHFAGSISGAFSATDPQLAATRADLAPSLQKAFGDSNSPVRAGNDVYRLLDRVKPASAPYFFIDCGSSDATFLPANRRLAATLSQHGLTYEYHEFPGSHSWQYWDQRLPDLLKAVTQHIASDVVH